MRKIIYMLCFMAVTVCHASEELYWTNVTDYYFNPPHTDSLLKARHCGLRRFRRLEDISRWYRQARRDLRQSEYNSSKKRKYLRTQKARLIYEYRLRREG